jgi:hypothetical protein
VAPVKILLSNQISNNVSAIETKIPKIVSGGQTGADRAALDWALSRGIECGGWCPKGRKAEDGRIAAKISADRDSFCELRAANRMERRDTGGTVVISTGPEAIDRADGILR